MGNETDLRISAEKIKGSLNGDVFIEVVGLDMEDDAEATFHKSVQKATQILGGNLDAFVNCYSYEGR